MVLRIPQVDSRGLAAIQAPQLTPIDLNRALQFGQQLEGISERRGLRQATEEFGQAALGGDTEALNRIALQGPDGAKLATSLQTIVQNRDISRAKSAQKELNDEARVFAPLVNKPEEFVRREIQNLALNEINVGGDRARAEELMRIANLPDFGEVEAEVQKALILGSEGNKFLQSFIKSGTERGGLASAKTEIFRNGAVIQALPGGQTQVRDPEGNIVTGQERLAVLDAAQKSGILQAGEKATAIKTAERKIEAETAGAVVAAQKGALRGQSAIDTAFETGEGIPVIKRAIDLLDSVKTGGFEQAKLRAAQTFGIEGADEGELSNLMGKAVLTQLRSVFGSAFTAEEGKGLERIEAGFGKNAGTNRRLLGNALATTERAVKRGIRAAKRAGQEEEAADLQALLDATLETGAAQEGAIPNITTQAQFDALPPGSEFIEDGVTMVKQ